jgi:predicted N-acetyltransferase YhbS
VIPSVWSVHGWCPAIDPHVPNGERAESSLVRVRAATDDDIEQIVALQVDRNGAECDAEVRALMADPQTGSGRFTVAEENGRVVSSLCLIPETMVMEGVTIATGQPEFVATLPDFEGRGLVREQMDLVHQWSASAGDLTQIIGGIAYFYRQFGYEYAIPSFRARMIAPDVQLAMPDGWSVRQAEAGDVAAIMALEAATQAGATLVCSRNEYWWRRHVEDGVGTPYQMAVRDGVVHGSAAVAPGFPGVGDAQIRVMNPAADEEDAVWSLLAHAAASGKSVAIEERRGMASMVDGSSVRHPRQYSLYVRVADPVALLDHLRPVLTARLARSHYANSSGRLLLSLYRSSITLNYEDGEVVGVEAGPSEQDPTGKGGAGVPPDLIATLIYGRYPVHDLEQLHPDVRLGRVADLMDVLFPKLESDLVLSV